MTDYVGPLGPSRTASSSENWLLDGEHIQPVRGVLPAVLPARSLGVRRVIVLPPVREAGLWDRGHCLEHLADMTDGLGRGNQSRLSWAIEVRRRFVPRRMSRSRHGGCPWPGLRPLQHKVAAAEDITEFRWASQALQDNARLAPSHNSARPGPDTTLVTTSPALCRRPVPTARPVTRPPFQAPHHFRRRWLRSSVVAFEPHAGARYRWPTVGFCS